MWEFATTAKTNTGAIGGTDQKDKKINFALIDV
jgi:hypothetical protein